MPCAVISAADELEPLRAALGSAVRVAIDTEVPVSGPAAGRLRVMSVATRAADGAEAAFVVDVADLDPTLLAPVLDGVVADGWNASFDARVLDAAVWASSDTTTALRWWDVQLADALLHQGRSGFTWYHGLAWATSHYLGVEAEGKGDVQTSYTADDPLSADQIAYAAADAVLTLWVGDAVRAELAVAGLDGIGDIEQAARPFLDQMERTGLPFDWEGWRRQLDDIERRRRDALGHLADLTGGGQGTLFDDVTEPTWNPGSDHQVKEALNRWSRPEVEAFTASRYGTGRLLEDTDSVSAPILREIGGPLSAAVLEWRNHAKILSTYGESIHDHVGDDGRLHPQYLQVVGTNTGRLASRNPNAQNFTPLLHPHLRPPEPGRVFVHADLSQAELRVLAQVANDEALRAAFARGDDVHLATAAMMFGFEPAALRASDPVRLAELRQVAKALNFGIAYGTGARALGRSLSAEGTPTTVDDAAELLATYRRTYPGTAAWAEQRIAEIQALRSETTAIDWPSSLRLASGLGDVAPLRRDLRRSLGRWPTVDELVAVHPRRSDHDPADLAAEIGWLLGYSAPVALVGDGRPFTFASRTAAGRRQQFNLHLDRLFLSVVVEAVRSSETALVEVRSTFARRHDVDLRAGPDLTDGQIERRFEDRALRRAYVEAVVDAVGTKAAEARLTRAASERVGAMVNAWRNAPIQGTVADVMLVAFADLDRRLRSVPDARPVQTVHDSVVVECDHAEAHRVAAIVRDSLERAMARFCPDVVPRADVDIRTSLADADTIDPDPTHPNGEPVDPDALLT